MQGFVEVYLKDWGPESLLGLVVLFVCLGGLVPRRSVKENQKILNEQLREAREREKYAVAAAEKLQEAVMLQSRHLEKLNEQSEMTIALIHGIRGAAPSDLYVSASGRHRGET